MEEAMKIYLKFNEQTSDKYHKNSMNKKTSFKI